MPTPPSGFASPVRPAGDDPAGLGDADTPAPPARPLFGNQATSTGWPDFRSTGSGTLGIARPVDESAGTDGTGDTDSTPGPGDSGPAGGFTDAEPTSLTHAEPVEDTDDIGTTPAPHPGPGDSGPAGGFTDVPTDVGAAGTHPGPGGSVGAEPITADPSGDDLFAPTPATHAGTGVTTEITGPIPVVRDPGLPAPAPLADDPFAPAPLGIDDASLTGIPSAAYGSPSTGPGDLGPTDARPVDDTPAHGLPKPDLPEHEFSAHDVPELDPQPIVPGLIDPRPVVAGEDTAAAAAGRITTEPEPPEQPASTPIGEPVARPDQGVRREAVARVSELAVPVGGLGSLAELGCWLAACQGECPPRPPVRAHVLLVAADHGIVEAGVSAFPPETGRARAVAAAEGRLPIAVAARSAGAALRVVDVGLVDALDPYGDAEYVVARGSGRIDTDDALTEEQAERAYLVGQLLADAEIDAGADVLVPGTLAVGATTPAAVLVAALTGAEPVAVVGRGSGIDDRVWMRKATVIRDALRRGKPYARKPLELLRRVAGADIVVLAGLLARAADRKVPVVIDGLPVGAAALLAEELAPGAREWWLAAQASSEPAMVLALEHLSLTPVLDLGIRTDDGTAAVATLPLLITAARLVAETGTAADTGISPLDNG